MARGYPQERSGRGGRQGGVKSFRRMGRGALLAKRHSRRFFRGIFLPALWTAPGGSGHHGDMGTTAPAEAELVKRNPEANQARFYRLSVWADLFGGYSLAREYGRIGQPGKLRLDFYAEEAQAVSAMMQLMRRKTRRGYQLLSGRQA